MLVREVSDETKLNYNSNKHQFKNKNFKKLYVHCGKTTRLTVSEHRVPVS